MVEDSVSAVIDCIGAAGNADDGEVLTVGDSDDVGVEDSKPTDSEGDNAFAAAGVGEAVGSVAGVEPRLNN